MYVSWDKLSLVTPCSTAGFSQGCGYSFPVLVIRWTCRGGWCRGCRRAASWWRILNIVEREATSLRCCRLGRLISFSIILLTLSLISSRREIRLATAAPPHPMWRALLWQRALHRVSLSCAFNSQKNLFDDVSFPEAFLAICSICRLNVILLSYVTFSISTSPSSQLPRIECDSVLLTSISWDLRGANASCHLLPEASLVQASLHPGNSCCFVLPVITVRQGDVVCGIRWRRSLMWTFQRRLPRTLLYGTPAMILYGVNFLPLTWVSDVKVVLQEWQ